MFARATSALEKRAIFGFEMLKCFTHGSSVCVVLAQRHARHKDATRSERDRVLRALRLDR